MTWIRKQFTGVGLTQYPTGPHLDAVARLFGGSVVLCVDVSGSMSGPRITAAIEGALGFFREAKAAGYDIGVAGWTTQVVSPISIGEPFDRVENGIASLTAGGGNDLCPTLIWATDQLINRTGDRVIVVFGDGDLGDREGSIRLAGIAAAAGIRIVTMGLGAGAAEQLAVIATDQSEPPRTTNTDTLAEDLTKIARTDLTTRR